MSQTATVAAEMWERDDLDQPAPDPSRAEMEDLTPARVGCYPSPVESTIGAQASGLCEEEIFHRDGRQAVLVSGGGFCAHANRRPFVLVPISAQISAPEGSWIVASAFCEVPHV